MSRFGGLGIQSLNSLAPAAMQAIQQAINSALQTSQFQQDQDRRRKEAKENRKAQKKAQKRAFGQQVGLLAGTAGVSALAGAGLGALPNDSGFTSTESAVDTGSITAPVSKTAELAKELPAEQLGQNAQLGNQALNNIQSAPPPQADGVFQPTGPQPSSVPSTFDKQTFVDAPTDRVSQLQSGSQPLGQSGGYQRVTPGQPYTTDSGGYQRVLPGQPYSPDSSSYRNAPPGQTYTSDASGYERAAGGDSGGFDAGGSGGSGGGGGDAGGGGYGGGGGGLLDAPPDRGFSLPAEPDFGNGGGSGGALGGGGGVNLTSYSPTKYGFGNTPGTSIARGALLGLSSVIAPQLANSALSLPFQAANLSLRSEQNALQAREQANLQDYRNASLGQSQQQIDSLNEYRNKSLEVDREQLGSLNSYRDQSLNIGQQRVDVMRNRPSSTLSDDQVESIIGGVIPRLDALPEGDADTRHAIIERTLKDYKFSPQQRSTVTDLFYKKYKYSPRAPQGQQIFIGGGY